MDKSIYLTDIAKSFGEKTLFENISINFHEGEKIGIVGQNGCGKTTLLRIIARQLPTDTGGIGNKNTIAYMEQQITCDNNITVYEYLLEDIQPREEYKMYPLLEELQINYLDINQTVKSLSGGEQKKLELAKILLQKADVLLLDEPTNHLDQSSLEILEKTIREHQGIVLFVSHDRHFLNMMCNKILEIDNKKITIYHGNYEFYKEEKEKRYAKMLEDYTVYQKEKKKRDQWFADLRQRASVYVNPARGRLLKSKEKYFEREVVAHEKEKPQYDKKLILSANGGTHKGKLICEMQKTNIGYENNLLIKNAKIEIRGKDRIIITGANGSGKTTFLKHIIENLKENKTNETFKIGNDIAFDYFDQHNEALESNEVVYDWFTKNIKTKTNESALRSQLAMIGLSQSEILNTMKNLSYGQKVKIKFLQMLSAKIDLLILDEPTNHLDIPTRETIEDMLEDYEGALLLVSHDQYFANKIKTNILYKIENKELHKEEYLVN